uniref:Glucose-6-phosphate 1-dehydrogenase n=1 Tax=Tetraselmis sp. GSL018 TaxID=582737 RepID=A0A061S3M8_9CHLO|mmetsp:Transcript_1181/g.2800  ORF Transcript_1181/g.2800 Transcript_1181/m.2800 type:complete len:495 (+) Transcript_1181:452-1936(+)
MHLTVIVLGASGDLAKKKTYPALYELFAADFLPEELDVIGYARSGLTSGDLRAKLKPFLKGDETFVSQFLNRCTYISGQYDGDVDGQGYAKLQEQLKRLEEKHSGPSGRLFYLALPPKVYPEVCKGIKDHTSDMSHCCPGSWLRLIVEKPFGTDLASSNKLAETLGALWPEDQLYRIDHYLGKELVQNLVFMRFTNTFLAGIWNKEHIDNVQITFKEPFGTDGRGGYFDSVGIIRDVVQNHLLQVLALLAMEKPVSLQPNDVRDEKCKVLRYIQPLGTSDVVLGQYTGGGGQPGYLDDATVPAGSRCPTFASCVLRIHNDRWEGVPFILKAGKALDEKKVEVRVQFRTVPASLWEESIAHSHRNELVMRLQPDEAIYMKVNVKQPGWDNNVHMSEMDLSYKDRYKGLRIPEAYERLILDCIRGDQQHFVRRDELEYAWRIFDPLLHAIDRGEVDPIPYPYGSRGPRQADQLRDLLGYVSTKGYVYKQVSDRSQQ